MAETALKLVLLGQDKSASKTLRGVGNEATKTHGKFSKLGGLAKGAMFGIAGAALAAGAGAVKFGGDSIKAFADAEKSQAKLTDAYKRFPKVQDVSIESLRKYNQALQRKTGADADDIAAGQASLAMFKLTGKQIKDTTPLMVDYATKTGKSMPDAAKTMGKALLGNTKALKDMGIDYKSTGDKAKDYANITELLTEKVGGYADSIPDAEKKQKILAASFGDLQEAVGEKLQPAMLGLVDAGQGVLDWLEQNPAVMEGASAAAGLLGDAFQGIWYVVSKWVAPALAWFLKMQVGLINGFADLTEAANNSPLGALIPDDAADKIRGIGEGLWDVANGLESLGKEPKVDLGADVAAAQAKQIDSDIARLNKKKIKLKAEGDDKGVKDLEKKIKALEKKKHKVKVEANVYKTGIKGIRVRDIARGNIRISAYASGIQSAPGGPAILGENGPEAVYLPTGSRVRSNGQTRADAAQGKFGGGSSPTIVAKFAGRSAPPKEFAKYIESELYKLWRGQGMKFRWDR